MAQKCFRVEYTELDHYGRNWDEYSKNFATKTDLIKYVREKAGSKEICIKIYGSYDCISQKFVEEFTDKQVEKILADRKAEEKKESRI